MGYRIARLTAAIAFLAALTALLPPAVEAQEDLRFERPRLPLSLRARMEQRRAYLREILPPGVDLHRYVADRSTTWIPGSTVRVAFQRGSEKRLREIAEVAARWTRHAHLTLDFRDGAGYRRWSKDATSYGADIRVAFDCSGYWSVVGDDAVDPLATRPHEASMCLQNLDVSPPIDWQATVLHEFGHALGFHHEHQRPGDGCEREFRWDDDPGYVPELDKEKGRYGPDDSDRRPGLFTLLGGPPNYWSPQEVRQNLKDLESSSAYVKSPKLDRKSIMMYSFPEWMLEKEERSRCYIRSNLNLSDEDKKGAVRVYPKSKAAIREIIKKRIDALQKLVASDKIPVSLKRFYEDRLKQIRQQLAELDATGR